MEINKTKKQPWASWDEWENCYNLLFSNLNSDNKYENNKNTWIYSFYFRVDF